MPHADTRIHELQCDAFLRRLRQVAEGDTTRRVDAGGVGHELGLPMERTLEIVEALSARGEVHRCSRLIDGPEVHLTRRGAGRRETAPA